MKTKFFLLGVAAIIGLTIFFAFNVSEQKSTGIRDEQPAADTAMPHVVVIRSIESIGELMAPAIVICDEKGKIKTIKQKMFTETNFDYNMKNLTKVLNEYYSQGYKLVGTSVIGKINYVTEYVMEKKTSNELQK